MKDKPTAAVCWNDLVAIGLMSGIARAGYLPGKDFSVTGYDDLEEASIATPDLTTVWNGQREVGRRAARALLERLSGVPAHGRHELINAGTACAAFDSETARGLRRWLEGYPGSGPRKAQSACAGADTGRV